MGSLLERFQQAFTNNTAGKSVSILAIVIPPSFTFLAHIATLEYHKSSDRQHDVFLYGFGLVVTVIVVAFAVYIWNKEQDNEKLAELKDKINKLETELAALGTQTEKLRGQLEDEKTKREAAEKERDDEKVIKIQAVTDCQTAKQLSTQLTQEKHEMSQELNKVEMKNAAILVCLAQSHYIHLPNCRCRPSLKILDLELEKCSRAFKFKITNLRTAEFLAMFIEWNLLL